MNDVTTKKADWRSFWSLATLQLQNSLNDKTAQFLIIPLAYWLTAEGLGEFTAMPHLLATLSILPYLLFAPLAGWLSDRFAKSNIIRISTLMQVVVIGAMLGFVMAENVHGTVGCFFLLAIQSTLLNPAKRGIIKELVGEQHLGSASGILEMVVVLAVCAGQIAAGYWFAHEISKGADGWGATQAPLQILLILTAIPVLLALAIKNTGAKSKTPFSWDLLWGHATQLKEIWKTKNIRLCGFGKSFFWGYAGFLNLWQIEIAREIAESSGREYGTVLSEIMIVASAGILLGGLVASLLCRRRIELGLLPIAGLLMLSGLVMMSLAPAGSIMMYISYGLGGFGGAMFLVPINAQLQNLCPPEKRGQILAGASLLDCLFGLMAVVMQFGLTAQGVPIWGQGLLLAVLVLGVLIYLMQLVSKDMVRMLVRNFCTRFYKIKVAGIENIPSEGGVLLTPNHVSYLDSLILSAACPRPVRFLMVRDCFDTPGVGRFARYADTIPISRERAKEAIRLAAEALKEGTVVCIFPEGQLTRHGGLCELKRGFEMIARQAKAPVVPVYMDGLWGSVFSFEREKMTWKIPRRYPYGMRVHFGEVLEGKQDINSIRLGQSLHKLSHAAMSQRREVTDESWIRHRLRTINLPSTLADQIQKMPWSELQPYVYNAVQLRELGVFRDRKRFGIEEGSGAELVVSLLAAICRGSTWLYSVGDELNTRKVTKCDYMFLGERLRPDVSKLRNCMLIDLNGLPVPSGCQEPVVYPARVKQGLITTFSMPHPNKIKPHDPLQPGWKPNSYGRILPGATRMPEEYDHEFFELEQ